MRCRRCQTSAAHAWLSAKTFPINGILLHFVAHDALGGAQEFGRLGAIAPRLVELAQPVVGPREPDRVGEHPEGIGCPHISLVDRHRRIGLTGIIVRAAEIAYSGDVYSADQALAWGWAARVLPDSAAAEERAREVAEALAGAPGTSIAHAKQVLRPRSGGLLNPPTEYAWNEEPFQ